LDNKNEENLSNLYELLKLERVLTGRSKGIYERENFRVKVKKSVGKWTGFGFSEKGQLYLYPHEALLLIEMV
jgi:tRNA-splicing endonuclease subunit sen54 N-term